MNDITTFLSEENKKTQAEIDDFCYLSGCVPDTVLISHDKRLLAKVRESIEGKRKKHWVFECNRGGKERAAFETFCGNVDCKSEDNKRVVSYNEALTDLLSLLPLQENE